VIKAGWNKACIPLKIYIVTYFLTEKINYNLQTICLPIRREGAG
jgi:hypothetical protein